MNRDGDADRIRAKAVRFIKRGQYYDALLAVRRLALPGLNGNGSDIEAKQFALEIVDLAEVSYLRPSALTRLADREDRAALIYAWALWLKQKKSKKSS